MQIAFSYLLRGSQRRGLLIELSSHVVLCVRVVQRRRLRGIVIAGCEIDANHEIELETCLNVLQKGRFLLKDALFDEERAFRGVASEWKGLIGGLEKGGGGGFNEAEVAMASVSFVLEEFDENGAILGRIRGEAREIRSRSCREWRCRWRIRASCR